LPAFFTGNESYTQHCGSEWPKIERQGPFAWPLVRFRPTTHCARSLARLLAPFLMERSRISVSFYGSSGP